MDDLELRKKELYSGVLVEEMAETIQAMSKINRFGINSVSPYGNTTNQQNLTMELGDVLAMIELMMDVPYFRLDAAELEAAKQKKLVKMKYWLENRLDKAD